MKSNSYINNQTVPFIILRMTQTQTSYSDLADNLCVEKEKIFELLNSKNDIKRKRFLIKEIIKYLNIQEECFFQRNLTFEKYRNSFFHSFFYCLEDRKLLYSNILDMKQEIVDSPYIIDVMMIEFVYAVILRDDVDKIEYLSKKFSEISFSLSNYYRKLYLIYFMNYLENVSLYQNLLDIFNEVTAIPCYDKQLMGRMYYTGMSIFRRVGNIEQAKQHYIDAKECFVKTNNIPMLENLNIKYSSLLRSIGSVKSGLENDLHLLEEYTIHNFQIRNIGILCNNIAWSYSLLYDYKNAVIYYKKALETLQDNEVYFNISLCCYKYGALRQAEEYLKLCRESKNCATYLFKLMDWLEEMLQNEYSEKSYKILKNILKDYRDDIEEIMRTMIQIEIINYYYYNHMYEEAIHALQPLMGKQLISPSELIFTKKNENRNDLLFSEDELTLRSQMMESDDLFFEDDELGEDEWEELDDSFSRFMHN